MWTPVITHEAQATCHTHYATYTHVHTHAHTLCHIHTSTHKHTHSHSTCTHSDGVWKQVMPLTWHIDMATLYAIAMIHFLWSLRPMAPHGHTIALQLSKCYAPLRSMEDVRTTSDCILFREHWWAWIIPGVRWWGHHPMNVCGSTHSRE